MVLKPGIFLSIAKWEGGGLQPHNEWVRFPLGSQSFSPTTRGIGYINSVERGWIPTSETRSKEGNKMMTESPQENAEWNEIAEDIKDCYELFIATKDRLAKLYSAILYSAGSKKFYDLGGVRQPKIIHKLFKFKGDITPSMLMSLVKEVETLSSFMKEKEA